METKVRDMVALVEAVPNLTIRIMSGTQPGLLEATLLDQAQPGTLITAVSNVSHVPYMLRSAARLTSITVSVMPSRARQRSRAQCETPAALRRASRPNQEYPAVHPSRENSVRRC